MHGSPCSLPGWRDPGDRIAAFPRSRCLPPTTAWTYALFKLLESLKTADLDKAFTTRSIVFVLMLFVLIDFSCLKRTVASCLEGLRGAKRQIQTEQRNEYPSLGFRCPPPLENNMPR